MPRSPSLPILAKRRAIADNLPRVDVIHDLPEAEKICPKDGAVLERIGEEESQQIDYIPARIQVPRHIRLKYACPCCQSHIKLADKPADLAEEQCCTVALRPISPAPKMSTVCPSIVRKSNSTALA